MADDREPYGRIVRETWVAWAKEQPDPKGSWLTGWDELDAGQREVDKRIGSAVATQAVYDAELENTRRAAQLFALGVHLPAILDALRIAVASGGYEYERKRYRAALEALGGGEEAP
jgi:hypothetical protein